MSKRSEAHEQLGESKMVGMPCACEGAFHGKEGGVQVLAGLAPSSQTVGSLFRVIHEQAKHSS
jgi:hypothetical protein